MRLPWVVNTLFSNVTNEVLKMPLAMLPEVAMESVQRERYKNVNKICLIVEYSFIIP
ncbi:hypothetical protein [Photorhabdus stackebrandtii]|uniref:hypothetical protein n=1 Tax=Photorhabdus stackebrandtii TaxID=1123042 RepID=UPI0014087436|nr:hypothetical protein [Photorhabdus stackebrandtii]